MPVSLPRLTAATYLPVISAWLKDLLTISRSRYALATVSTHLLLHSPVRVAHAVDSAVLARYPKVWSATMTTTSAWFMKSRVRLSRLLLSTRPSQAVSWRFGTTIRDFRSIPVHVPLSHLSHRCILIPPITTSSLAQLFVPGRNMSTLSSTSSL